ncbi:MAG: hypothetical protein FWE20_07470 [Defluviitaleaceae bacterium]|nr:hypothetical protein [Defluviitaleaceae bacterium]
MLNSRKKSRLTAALTCALIWFIAANTVSSPFFHAEGYIGSERQVLNADPAISFEDTPVYDGMELPKDATLTLSYEFTAYPGDSFDNIMFTLPEPLLTAHTGSIEVTVRDGYGNYVDLGSLFIDGDGIIRFSLDLPQVSNNHGSVSAVTIPGILPPPEDDEELDPDEDEDNPEDDLESD